MHLPNDLQFFGKDGNLPANDLADGYMAEVRRDRKVLVCIRFG